MLAGGPIWSYSPVIFSVERVHEAGPDQRGADDLLPGLDRGTLPSGARQKHAGRGWLLGQPRGQQPPAHHHADRSVAPHTAPCPSGGDAHSSNPLLEQLWCMIQADLKMAPTSLPWQMVTIREKCHEFTSQERAVLFPCATLRSSLCHTR